MAIGVLEVGERTNCWDVLSKVIKEGRLDFLNSVTWIFTGKFYSGSCGSGILIVKVVSCKISMLIGGPNKIGGSLYTSTVKPYFSSPHLFDNVAATVKIPTWEA